MAEHGDSDGAWPREDRHSPRSSDPLPAVVSSRILADQQVTPPAQPQPHGKRHGFDRLLDHPPARPVAMPKHHPAIWNHMHQHMRGIG